MKFKIKYLILISVFCLPNAYSMLTSKKFTPKKEDLEFIAHLAEIIKLSKNNTNKNMGLIILNELLKTTHNGSNEVVGELENSEIRYPIYINNDESVLPINKDNFEEVVELLRNHDYLWD